MIEVFTSCLLVEMQLKEELEAAKILSRAGTNPQVHEGRWLAGAGGGWGAGGCGR